MIWKIYLKWLVACLGIGIIPVLILGASPGGIALSPIIIIACIIIGLIGGAIHSVINSSRFGNKSQKALCYVIGALVASIVIWLFNSSSSCSISEEYANKRIQSHFAEFYKLDLKYLSSPTFSSAECNYTYEYESPTSRYKFVISDYGQVHTWDYAAHK